MPARAGESMLRRLLNISGPFFLGSLARLSVTICTTVLVGRIGSSVQLAAIGFATVMCNITGHSMVQGMGAALDTLSSQAFGAGQVPKLGMLAQRSFAISLCMVCLPASILWIAIGPLMRSAGMDAELADQVGQFALWRIPGLVTQCAYVSLAKTLNAQRMTKPGMYCSWIACPIGLSCTYVAVVYLRLGLAGAAASATLRDVVQLLLLAVGAWKFCPEFRACWEDGLFDVRALQEWPRYMKLGFASLIICCVSWWSWDAATVLCSRLPENTTTMLATQTVVVNIISLLYLAPGAVARGASALVGSALGANNAYEAKCAFHASAFAVVVVVIAQSSVLYALRHEAGYLFTQDEEVVTEVASILAPWGVAFASVGGIQCGLSGVVEGLGRQKIAAPIVALAYWAIGLPAGIVLGFVFDYGLPGIWAGMLGAVCVHCASYVVICACLDWYEAAEKAVARALEGGRGGGWHGSASAAPQVQGGSGTTPRVGIKTGTGGAAGIRDPFFLPTTQKNGGSSSSNSYGGHGSWGQEQERQSVGLGAQLCDALLFPSERRGGGGTATAATVSEKGRTSSGSSSSSKIIGQTSSLIPKVDSPAQVPSIYRAL